MLTSGDWRKQGRYVVLTRGDDTYSADGSARSLRELGGGATNDANTCWTPRQISFDFTGENIALLRDSPPAVILHSLQDGTSRTVYRPAVPLWRIGFTSQPQWLHAIEATDEFPKQQTSCVSQSRKAFAASYSSNSLDPESFSFSLIGTDGRHVPVGRGLVLLSATAYVSPDSRETPGTVHRIDGSLVVLPEGCELKDAADGSRVVALQCGVSTELFDPATQQRFKLPHGQSMQFLSRSRTSGPDGTWYGITLPIAGAPESGPRFHLGRLRIEDLRIERGPAVYFRRYSNLENWLTGGERDDYFLFNIGTGEVLKVRAKDTRTVADGFALQLRPTTFLLLDPQARLQARVYEMPGIGNGRGCFMRSRGKRDAGMSTIDLGPWTRVCIIPAT